MKRIWVVLAGLSAGLALVGPVQAVRQDIVALVLQFSTPPAQPFLIDPAHGSIAGLKLHAPAAAYVKKLGIPDYIGPLESSKVEMLWTRTVSPKSGWATATLRSAASTTVDQLRFAGLFKTTRGDKHGTALGTFLRHWQLSGPVVTGVVANGQLVEYNVVVGGVVFAFDQHRILAAVGLAPASTERSLCVIPAACVVTKLH